MTQTSGILAHGAVRALHANGWLVVGAAGLGTAASVVGPRPADAWFAGVATLAAAAALAISWVTARRFAARWTTWRVAHGCVRRVVHEPRDSDDAIIGTVWIEVDGDDALAEVARVRSPPTVGTTLALLIGPGDEVVIARPGATVEIVGNVVHPRRIPAALCAGALLSALAWWGVAVADALW